MRIGINALYLIPGGVGGTEIYLRNLLNALARIDRSNEYVIFTNCETGSEFGPAAPNFQVLEQPVNATSRPWRLAWEQTGFLTHLLSARVDCLFNPGFTAPVLAQCPMVTVFHDLQHKLHPEHFTFSDLHGWRFFLWLAARRSNLILAVSEQTKKDLHRFYKLPDSAVRVASLGVEPEFYTIAERRTPEPFILCVSTLHPHKNLERLIRAFAIVHSNRPEYKLVLVGMRGFHTDVIESVIAELELTDVVQITGWIEREDLYDLYRRAAAFVYPSTFEGFGIPVVEAMAAGVPLACSDIEPLRSNASDAALLFPPDNSYDMADKILRLIMDEDLRRCLVQRGLARAREFTWEHTAECTLRALQDAVSAKGLRA